MKNNLELLSTPENCLHRIVEEIAIHDPKNIAVSFEGKQYSYAELNKDSNRLAHKIIDKFGSEPANIAILSDNNYELIISTLAVLKAGKSYLNLEVDFPLARNKAIVDDSNCELLITRKAHFDNAQQLKEGDNIILADDDFLSYSEENPGLNILPESLAYIAYTSGSTGKPKGAKHSHRSMIHLIIRFNEVCTLSKNDKFAVHLAPAFSAHGFVFYAALLNGCCLSLFNIKSDNLSGFLHWFEKEHISVTMMIPSFLRHILAIIEKKKVFNQLRNLIIGGESLYRSDIEKLRKVLNKNTKIINIYASTEAYINCAMVLEFDTPLMGNNVPIGYPVRDMQIKIIGENGESLEPNKTGKIQINSKYISTGYWNEDLNQDIIIREKADKEIITFNSSDLAYMDSDGYLVHVGREENYIKLRGFRIDLNEIVNILLEDKNLKEAVCIVRKNPAGVLQIIACLAPAPGTSPDLELLKEKLIRLLPDYMIPSHFVILNEIPKISSGKIDSINIPDPDWGILQENTEFIEAGNELESEIVKIFESSLKTKPIGIRNNFLKIGIDSLSLFLVFNEIEKKYNIKLKVDSIVDDPTIEAIAKFINDQINNP